MGKQPRGAMGKRHASPQNGEVAGDFENGTRRRPEDIVADAFPDHVPASATEGWSVRSRRTILLAMAVAGAVMVAAGLALTGGLGPGPTSPRPLQAGSDASVLARSLLRPLEADQATTTTNAPATPLPTSPTPSAPRRDQAPALVPSPTSGTAAGTATPSTGATPVHPAATPTTSTTRPCALIG